MLTLRVREGMWRLAAQGAGATVIVGRARLALVPAHGQEQKP